MPTINFTIVSAKNEGLILSPSEIANMFLFGIPLKRSDGTAIDEATVRTIIAAAQKTIEKFLGIKITKQVLAESREYCYDDFFRWLYVRTSFPVTQPISLEGNLNDVEQIKYPKEWISAKKSNNGQYYRKFSLVPNQQKQVEYFTTYVGLLPNLITPVGYVNIPDFWKLAYITGFEPGEIPEDLVMAVGKLAAIDLLNIASDLIIGPGLTGSSLSLDGLSQSIQTNKTNPKGAFGARIAQYLEDLKERLLPTLQAYYKGITFTAA